MKKVPMMMKKNEEKKRRIVFVSSSSSSSSYLYQLIDIELKRLTLVCANFKRKTFAFSRQRATCSFVTRRSFMSAIDDSLSLSLIAFSLRALRKKKTKKKRKEERFSGKRKNRS